MFVGILPRDSARDFGVEFESSRHREIFEISSRAVKKLQFFNFKSTNHDRGNEQNRNWNNSSDTTNIWWNFLDL